MPQYSEYGFSRIDAGLMFSVDDLQTGIKINTTSYWLIRFPPDKLTSWRCQMRIAIGAGAFTGGKLFLFENSVVSANGTELAVYNRDRNSPNVCQTRTFWAPTVTSEGTVIDQRIIGTYEELNPKFIMPNNAVCLLKLRAEANCDAAVHFEWFEGPMPVP